MADDELIAALRRDSRDESSDVRQKVARILMERSDPEALDILVELAGDPDWRVRKAAIEGLEANPTEGVVQALIPALHDQANAGRRNAAAEALRVFGVRALPYLLFELGRTADADGRIALATILGDIPAEESAAALVGLLASDDVNVASAAIVSLGKMRRPETIPALVRVLSGDNAWLHYHAIETLGRLRAVDALPAIVACDQNPALKKAVLEAAGAIGGFGAIDLLAARLATSPVPDFALLRALVALDDAPRPSLLARREREYLRRKFRENAPPGAAGAFALALKKTERRDRKADLLRALGWLGDPDSLPLLIAELSRDSAEAAEHGLEDFGEAAIPALTALLSPAADERKIELAIRLLGRHPSSAMVFPVLAVLEHDSPPVRRDAVELLGRIGDPRAIDYLVAHLGDGDAGVDAAAVEALESIPRAHPEAREPLRQRLGRAIGAADGLTRANALTLLAGLGGEDFRTRLLSASKDEDAVVRGRAVAIASREHDPATDAVLEHALADESAHVRQAAVQALCASGRVSRHRDAIFASLEDDDLWVRAAACRCLGALRGDEAARRLREIAARGEPPERIASLEALGGIGGVEAWEAISAALDDPDAEVRQAALAAAAESREPAAEREIERRTSDGDWRLRATALEAIGRRARYDRRPVLRRALLEDPDDLVARSALTALEAIAVETDVATVVEALSREAIAEELAAALLRFRRKFPGAVERAWREADPRRAAILSEVLRADAAP
ncbi:MAG TPA: HEAT repeat domain-containing protein [Thermoanaerobaculia bacterium]|nr:HEAT repeat domain-containing protein [Thermoanaerobaculia bacterium]